MDFKKIIKDKKVYVPLLIVLFLILIALWTFPLRMYHWWDEVVYLQNAEVIFSGVDNYSELSFRPPLLSILFAGIFFFWHSPLAASVLTSLLCFLLVPLIFLIGKKYFNFWTGLIAAITVLSSTFILENAHYLLTDIPAVSLMAISFFLLFFDNKKLCLFFSGAFLSLAVLMKFSVVLFVPVIALYALIKKFNFKKIFILGGSSFLFILPYLLWAQIEFGNFLSPFIIGVSKVTARNHGIFFYFLNLTRAFTSIIIPGIFFWIFLFYKKIKEYSKNIDWIKINIVFLFWITIFLVYLSYTSHKELRYILPITLPIILISSQGWDYFLKFLKKIDIRIFLGFIGICILILLGLSIVEFNENISPPNFSFIEENINPRIEMSRYILENTTYDFIYTNHYWPVYAYYTGLETKFIFSRNDFYTNYSNFLNEKDLILVNTDVVMGPRLSWIEDKQQFKFVEKKGEVFAFEFIPLD